MRVSSDHSTTTSRYPSRRGEEMEDEQQRNPFGQALQRVMRAFTIADGW
jgi:hypothetical protein